MNKQDSAIRHALGSSYTHTQCMFMSNYSVAFTPVIIDLLFIMGLHSRINDHQQKKNNSFIIAVHQDQMYQ